MIRTVVKSLFLVSIIFSAANATDGIIEDGKWTILAEPVEVGNKGLIAESSLSSKDYESGPIRDFTFACEFKEPEFTIRVIGENLAANNGEVIYSIDGGEKKKWDMSTQHRSGVFLQAKGSTVVNILRELLDHEKLNVFLKLEDGRSKELEFNISGIKDHTELVRVLCGI